MNYESVWSQQNRRERAEEAKHAQRVLRGEAASAHIPAAEFEALGRLDDDALARWRKGAKLAIGAVAQPRLLCGDGDGAAGAIKEHHRADARADDDSAVDALTDLHLLARVEHVDFAVFAALDLDTNRSARVFCAARAGWLEKGCARLERALDTLARPGPRATPDERRLLLGIHVWRAVRARWLHRHRRGCGWLAQRQNATSDVIGWRPSGLSNSV